MPDPSRRDRTAELNGALEALHFGFRAVVARPDAMLARRGLSRAHHRILYFVARGDRPSVNDLLRVLGVTKQSLNGPLRQLIEQRLVATAPDRDDGRVKRLVLTAAGGRLERALSGDQRRRFARAFAIAGPETEQAWRRVMSLLGEERPAGPVPPPLAADPRFRGGRPAATFTR